MDDGESRGLGSMSRLWWVGDTVRRERADHSDAVNALLLHLERRGYPYSRRFLGIDDQGRDILSRVPGRPVPTLRGPGQLVEVGHAIAGFAAAVQDFPFGSWRWRDAAERPPHADVMIHADIAPWNMLDGAPPPALAKRPARLRLFVDACGMDAAGRARLLDEIARVQVDQAARVAAGALRGDDATTRHWAAGRFTVTTARSLLWLDPHRDELSQALR